MDNRASLSVLQEGASSLGIALDQAAANQLVEFASELIRWNHKFNLTAITEVSEVLEKHILDSLALLKLPLSGTLLDIGCGAGFPGIPLKLVRRELDVTLADAVQKKIGFVKYAIARLGVSPGARAIHARAEGDPEREGLPRADWVVSRALREPGEWIALGRHYAVPNGRVVVMLGTSAIRDPDVQVLGCRLVDQLRYQLPFSRAERAIAVVAPINPLRTAAPH